MKQEIAILTRLSHPNIIKLHESVETSTKINLVMEYIKGKSLYQYIRKRPGNKLDEEEAKQVFRQVTEGMAYMHT